MLPKHLVYWINSYPVESCALVNTEKDLQDGVAICELASFVGIPTSSKQRVQGGKQYSAATNSSAQLPFKDRATSGIGRIRSVLIAMSEDAGGWNKLPLSLRQGDAAKKMVLSMSAATKAAVEGSPSDSDSNSSSSKAQPAGEELIDMLSYLHSFHTGRKYEPDTNKAAGGNGKSLQDTFLRTSVTPSKPGAKDKLATSLKLKAAIKMQQRDTGEVAKIVDRWSDVEPPAKRPVRRPAPKPPANLLQASSPQETNTNYKSLVDKDAGRDSTRASFPLRHTNATGRGADAYSEQDSRHVHFRSSRSSQSYGGVHGDSSPDKHVPIIPVAATQRLVRQTALTRSYLQGEQEAHIESFSHPTPAAKPSAPSAAQAPVLLSVSNGGGLRHISQYPCPSAAELLSLADWLRVVGVHAPVPADAFSSSERSKNGASQDSAYNIYGDFVSKSVHCEHQFDRDCDEWRNGIALSELAAIVVRTSGKSRQLVKQVPSFDDIGRPLRPRLLIAGTETTVTKKVQAIRNIQLSLNAMRYNCEPVQLLINLNPNATDIFHGAISIWGVVNVIYQQYGVLLKGSSVSPTVNSYSASYGAGYTKLRRARSVSPAAAKAAEEAAAPSAEIARQLRSRSLSPQARGKPTVRFASAVQGGNPLRGATHVQLRGGTGPSQGDDVIWDNNSAGFATNIPGKLPLSHSFNIIRSAALGQGKRAAWDSTMSPTYLKFGTAQTHTKRDALLAAEKKAEKDLSKTVRGSTSGEAEEERFRSTFPEDTGLDEAKQDEGSSRAQVHIRQTKKRESELERLAARQHALKIRKNAFMHVQEKAHKNQLKQYAEDFVGAATNDGAEIKAADARSKGLVQDGPNTGTTNKKKQQQQHLEAIKRAARYSQLGLSKLRILQQQSISWVPPVGDPAKVAALRKVPIAHVSARQIITIREWMLSLGLSVLDGEGGYFFWDAGRGMAVHSYPAPPLPLALDRLRNGQLLCSLVHVLEPGAATHAHLAQLLHKGKPSSSGMHAISGATAAGYDATGKKSASSTLVPCDGDGGLSVDDALENIERSLWILKIRRCPPIPEHLLLRSEDILRGKKDVLWGLLWEVLQAYPYSNDWANQIQNQQYPEADIDGFKRGMRSDILPASGLANNERGKSPPRAAGNAAAGVPPGTSFAETHDFGSHPTLPYSSRDRRKLDQSLVKYIHSLGLLKPAAESAQNISVDATKSPNVLAVQVPQSMTALETCIRDGTLLCALCEKVLGLGLNADFGPNVGEGQGFVAMAWNRSPHTYQQCLGNITKVVHSLRNIATGLHSLYRMSGRFLYTGCEEAILRGNWDTILGIFEDIRRCSDKVEPRPAIPRQLEKSGETASSNSRGNGYLADSSEWPYFGPLGSYSNIDAWGEKPAARSNQNYLANRQYAVRQHMSGNYLDPDIVPEVIVADDGGNTTHVENSNMRMPAKLALNPLAWRGEEVHNIGNEHRVDLIPKTFEGDLTRESIEEDSVGLDALYTRDENGRKVRDPDTGIEIATDFVTVIEEKRGQRELEEEFRIAQQTGKPAKNASHIGVDEEGNMLSMGNAANIYPDDKDKLDSMRLQNLKSNAVVSETNAAGGDGNESHRDNWKFKKVNHLGMQLESSITLSPHRASSPKRALALGVGGHAVETSSSTMRVRNLAFSRKGVPNIIHGEGRSKSPNKPADPRLSKRFLSGTHGMYANVDVGESYPGKSRPVISPSSSPTIRARSLSPPRSSTVQYVAGQYTTKNASTINYNAQYSTVNKTKSVPGKLTQSMETPASNSSPRHTPGTPHTGTPADAAEDVFIRTSFHISPTPLTPMSTGTTPRRREVRPSRSPWNSAKPWDSVKPDAADDTVDGLNNSMSHIYSKRGTDYDDSASQIEDSPGDVDKPAEIDLSDDSDIGLEFHDSVEHSMRNTHRYNPNVPLNNRDNNRSKINPLYSSSPSTGYLAMPSTVYISSAQDQQQPQREIASSGLSKSRGSTDRPDWGDSYIPTPTPSNAGKSSSSAGQYMGVAVPAPALQSTGALTGLDRNNIVRVKPSTMILSNAAPSVRGHISDIVEMTRLKKAAALVKWLQDLGVLAKEIKMINVPQILGTAIGTDNRNDGKGSLYRPSSLEILATFYDGVTLCRLVEKLEYCDTLPGTILNPKSPAQRLQNIRRALEKISTSTGKMPLSQLMCAEEVAAGKTEVIFTLLVRIQKVYKIRTM